MKTPVYKRNRAWIKRMLKGKRKAADFLNNATAQWSKGRQLLFLYLLCGAFTAGICCNIFFYPKIQKHALPAIRLPPPKDSLSVPLFSKPKN